MQGKRNQRASDPAVDVKQPHFFVQISDSFMEALAALSRSGMTQSQNIVTSALPGSGPPTSMPTGIFQFFLELNYLIVIFILVWLVTDAQFIVGYNLQLSFFLNEPFACTCMTGRLNVTGRLIVFPSIIMCTKPLC